MKSAKPHDFHYHKKAKITFCKRCGHMPLKNEASQRETKRPCADDINPCDCN